MADYATLLSEYGENDEHLAALMKEYSQGVTDWVIMETTKE